MPQFTAISRDSHAGKKWQPFKNYGFASTSALAPIVGVEIARAALSMPLAFFQEARPLRSGGGAVAQPQPQHAGSA